MASQKTKDIQEAIEEAPAAAKKMPAPQHPGGKNWAKPIGLLLLPVFAAGLLIGGYIWHPVKAKDSQVEPEAKAAVQSPPLQTKTAASPPASSESEQKEASSEEGSGEKTEAPKTAVSEAEAPKAAGPEQRHLSTDDKQRIDAYVEKNKTAVSVTAASLDPEVIVLAKETQLYVESKGLAVLRNGLAYAITAPAPKGLWFDPKQPRIVVGLQ